MNESRPRLTDTFRVALPTLRVTSPDAERLLHVPHTVLDTGTDGNTPGHVTLVDYLGGDRSIEAAARTSYQNETRSIKDAEALLDYLARNAHTSPFEMVSLVFMLKLPLFVFAQLVRHRTAKLSAESARYSVLREEFYLPAPADIRKQDRKNRQATTEAADEETAREATQLILDVATAGYECYQLLLGKVLNPDDPPAKWERDGIAREMARMVLPQNVMTTVCWKIDLHNLSNVVRLREDSHAQTEIRPYARQFAVAAAAVAPLAWAALSRHVVHARKLSADDLAALGRVWAFFKGEVDDPLAALAREVGASRARELAGLLEGGSR